MENAQNTDPQRRALGRGLAALLPGTTPATGPSLKHVPIDQIRTSSQQPRKNFAKEQLEELAASIRTRGVIQPLVLRKEGNTYVLVAGERRWRAAALAGLTEVPAIIKDLSDSDSLQVALIENLQREDLDPIEEALAFKRLVEEHRLTQDDVAKAVGKSRSAVANSLRLLKLPERVLAMVGDGSLTAGHARALMMAPENYDLETLAMELVTQGASVRQAEQMVRNLQQRDAPVSKDAPSPFEEKLQKALGTKVRVYHRNGSGRIEIHFYSLEQLDGIIARLG